MSPVDRSMLALVCGSLLGVAFVDAFHQQQIKIGLVLVAVVIAGYAAIGTTRLSSARYVLTFRNLGLVLFGVGSLVFVTNLVSLSNADSGLERALYAVGTLALIGCGVAYLVGGNRQVFWVGFLISYAAVIMAVIGDIVSIGVFTDVQLFQHDAVAALFRGENPFALTFRDIYPPAASANFYAEGVSVDGVLQFGYPYFPLGLLIVAPFEILADYRIALALAIVGVAFLMSRMTDSENSTIAAMIFLLTSPSFAGARNGWSDPVVVLALVAVVAVATHRPKGVSFAMGILFAIKQYTVFLAVPSLLLFERPWSVRSVARHFAIAGGVFLLVTLPFVLWNPAAFWFSVVKLQFIQPFRPDSVALPALVPDWWQSLPPILSIGAPFLAVAAASIVVAMRAPTGAQGFALGAAFVLLIAFVSSKQAFVNYYLVATGALFAAAAAVPSGDGSGMDHEEVGRMAAIE